MRIRGIKALFRDDSPSTISPGFRNFGIGIIASGRGMQIRRLD
jgi:hypothetical protein